MTAKRSKFMVFLFVNAIVCIILKLLISYLFPLSRLLLCVIVPIMAILIIIFMVKNRKTLLDKRVLRCWIVAFVALIFTLLPIDRQLELTRFHVAKGFYNAAAEEVQKEIASSEDTAYARYNLKFPYSLLSPCVGSLWYCKRGNSVVIWFYASSSLSISRDYVYFSDKEARYLFEHQWEIDSVHERPYFDKIEPLDGSQWAYVFDWGNGNGMEPKDPNL